MFLRVADSEKEPLNTILDSEKLSFPQPMCRVLEMMPVFNIIYGFWSENNVQFDTVLESLQHCDELLLKLQNMENQGKKHIIASLVNSNEELGVLPIEPLKEMLDLYQRFRDKSGIVLKDNDLTFIKEYFYEFVRRSYFPEKNSRLNSVFFYENLEVASMTAKELGHKFTDFCMVEIVETRSFDRYDQRWLTDIRTNCVFVECLEAVKNYWKGEMTDYPKIECLFDGKYVLKELR